MEKKEKEDLERISYELMKFSNEFYENHKLSTEKNPNLLNFWKCMSFYSQDIINRCELIK